MIADALWAFVEHKDNPLEMARNVVVSAQQALWHRRGKVGWKDEAKAQAAFARDYQLPTVTRLGTFGRGPFRRLQAGKKIIHTRSRSAVPCASSDKPCATGTVFLPSSSPTSSPAPRSPSRSRVTVGPAATPRRADRPPGALAGSSAACPIASKGCGVTT